MQFSINGRFLTQQMTGVQRYASELLNALDSVLDDRPDVQITVWSPTLSTPAPPWRNLVHREAGRLSGNLWEQLELPFLSKGQLLFCPGNSAPLISLLGLQPVVVTVHDLSYKYFPDAYSPAFKAWYSVMIPLEMRAAKMVLTVSETERQSIIRHFPVVSGRIRHVANGGWPGDVYPASNDRSQRDTRTVLYVGSLSKRKNFPAMLETAIALSRKRQFRFRFVGGTTASLVSTGFTIPPDVEHLISFEGQTNDVGLLAKYYSNASCFLFPSLYESSGLPPVEAMTCGCPVIASDIPALKERCGEAALYCDPESLQSIIDTVESLLDSPEMQASLRMRGYERAKQFTWKNCAQETLALIGECQETNDRKPSLIPARSADRGKAM